MENKKDKTFDFDKLLDTFIKYYKAQNSSNFVI